MNRTKGKNAIRRIIINMENIKRVIGRAIIVGIAAVMSMSLFACKPKEKVEKIEIPLEQSVNSNETKAIDNEQAIKDAMAVYNVDSSIAEKTIWKKVHHAWPEPPEEQKIYTNKDNGESTYAIAYNYKGKKYWVGCNNVNQRRTIYNRTTDNPLDVGPKDRVMIVGADKTEEIWQLLEILDAGDNIVKGVTKGKVEQHTKLGID